MSTARHEGHSWEKLDLQAIEAQDQLSLWNRKDRALHDELIEEARTELQRELIRRAVASGHTPQEVELFADVIRPLSDAEAYAACTLDPERAARETLEDRLWAEADPVHGYLLNGYQLLPEGPALVADGPPTLSDAPAIVEPALVALPAAKPPASAGPARARVGDDGFDDPTATDLPGEPAAPRSVPARAPAGADAFDSGFDAAARARLLRPEQSDDGGEAGDDGDDDDGADGDDALHAEPSYRLLPPEGNRPQMVYIAPRPPAQVTATAGRVPPAAPTGRAAPAAPSAPPMAVASVAAAASSPSTGRSGERMGPLAGGSAPSTGRSGERIKLPPGMIVDRPGYPAPPKSREPTPAPAPPPGDGGPGAGGVASPARPKQPPAPGRFAEDLFNEAGRALGVSYTEQQVDGDGIALERALAHAAAALERGVPVPAVIGPSLGEYRRYVLFLQVQADGSGRAFELYDPMEQEAVWANEADLIARAELPFADKSNRRITSIALPTPPQT